MKGFFSIVLMMAVVTVQAQKDVYTDSIEQYQQRYVKNHEVVRGKDKKLMQFFPVNEKLKVQSKIQLIDEAPWFKMETSSKDKHIYRVYAVAHFRIHDTVQKLHIYQSQRLMEIEKYADHLFIPFTDLTSGEESYENGRYIDLKISDLETGSLTIDFNKAYNPYCAYVSDRYSCPIPPAENHLPIAIRAGEKKIAKDH